jgi:Ca2+-binding EF-hand superfamily protein
MVDVHKKGRIAYADFLKVLVPKGDHKPSTHHDSFRSYMRKGSFYSLVPQGVAPIRLNTQNRMTPVGRLSLADVQQVMMKKLKNQQKNLQMLLQQRDPDGTGYISKSLLLQVLRKLDVFIMHPQLEEVQLCYPHPLILSVSSSFDVLLLCRYAHTNLTRREPMQVLEAQDIASQGDKVKHSEFLAKFLNAKQVGTETNVAVPVGGRQGSQTHRPFSTKVPQDTNELLQRIRAKLRGRWEDLQKAFFHEQDQALDFKVGREELARILHVFGVPITQDQSKILFENLGDSMDYSDFVRLLDTGSRRPTATKRLPTGNLTAREYRTRGAQVEIISRPATSRVLKA